MCVYTYMHLNNNHNLQVIHLSNMASKIFWQKRRNENGFHFYPSVMNPPNYHKPCSLSSG